MGVEKHDDVDFLCFIFYNNYQGRHITVKNQLELPSILILRFRDHLLVHPSHVIS